MGADANAEIIAEIYRPWLLPRTYTIRISDAQWVIAYHVLPESLDVQAAKKIRIGPNVNVVEVRR